MADDTPAPAPTTRRLPNGETETTHPDGRVETRKKGGIVEVRHPDRTVTTYPRSRAHAHGHTETVLDAVPGGIIVSEPPEAEDERFRQRIKDRARR